MNAQTPRARAQEIAAAAAAMYRVTPNDVFGRSRRKPCVQARAHVAKELRFGMGWSYPHIGRFLQRDHTSVMSLLGRLAKNAKRGRRRPMNATIPTIPVARRNLASISPAYRDAVKALERVAKEIGFGKEYDDAFSVVQREARKAERMLAERASA